MTKIYLDEAATTKPKKEVIKEINKYLTEKWYNPSSLYSEGKSVADDIHNARENVAKCINANTDEIYFTSGASESNNWVIRGFCEGNNEENVIITTPIEHSSILEALNDPYLFKEVHFCKVDEYGFVDMESLEYLLKLTKGKNVLVSIIWANNEIGTIQDMKEISKLVHSYGAYLHTDATQALPYIPIDVKDAGINYLSASAQKIGGLKGSGFLYKKNGMELSPLIYGEQENGLRGGTENVIGIIALGKAVELIKYDQVLIHKRDYMIYRLEKYFGCKLNGDLYKRLHNNINVTFPEGITGEDLLYMLDAAGIQVSTGSACNSKNIKPSHVLTAIGLFEEEAMRTIRFTLPANITIQKIDNVLEEIKKAIKVIKETDSDDGNFEVAQ